MIPIEEKTMAGWKPAVNKNFMNEFSLYYSVSIEKYQQNPNKVSKIRNRERKPPEQQLPVSFKLN